MRELEKNYNPKEIEDRNYKRWLEKGYFKAKVDEKKKAFCIIMPPPNITGKLHMGHALNNTLQDIFIRYKRMQGYETLWQPGTDHAAIATEVKVIDKLKSEGINKHELGREGFLKRAFEWKEEYGSQIISQLKKLGASADWDRERFTLDEAGKEAVLESFVSLYEKGYIYKGTRIINWCPCCKTTISEAEVEHLEKEGKFYHIRYKLVDEDSYIQIATTRPETLLGDTAVAVNPKDERYKHLIGKKVHLPLTDRQIEIIADEYVDKDFGTGFVKITPAHDPNDFMVGKRHNLEEINMMNDDATINLKGSKYDLLDRYEARKQIVEDLEKEGLLVKIENHVHNVGVHDRCQTVIEPLIKPQWFVKMEELAKPAIEAIEKKELKFVPESYSKTYLHWLNNIRDWSISRQLWWGHRIPAYICDECGHINVSRNEIKKCEKCSCTKLSQEEDTLDTWFSSALWPFSTLGWPKNTKELEYFYPTNVLVTAYDIIFFWVVRMVFSALFYTNKVPFDTVLIHGLVRDANGRKMSKSLGNGIDPLEIIEKYGADALRMSLVSSNAPGNDTRFYMEKVEASRNFANKVWNASRFIMMNLENDNFKKVELKDLTLVDKWIIAKLNNLKDEISSNIDKYEVGVALTKIHDFIWEEFCDWYIEMVKARLWNKEDATRDAALFTLNMVLSDSLKILHPFMPFITEEIYKNLNEDEESIMISSWPKYEEKLDFKNELEEVELIKEAIRGIRNIRTSMNVAPSKKTKVYLVSKDEKIRNIFEKSAGFILALAYANEIIVSENDENIGDDFVAVNIANANIYLPFAELVDIEKEKERLEKEKTKLEGEIKRATSMLSNEKFVEKAPKSKIDEERAKLEKYETLLKQVKEQIDKLILK